VSRLLPGRRYSPTAPHPRRLFRKASSGVRSVRSVRSVPLPCFHLSNRGPLRLSDDLTTGRRVDVCSYALRTAPQDFRLQGAPGARQQHASFSSCSSRSLSTPSDPTSPGLPAPGPRDALTAAPCRHRGNSPHRGSLLSIWLRFLSLLARLWPLVTSSLLPDSLCCLLTSCHFFWCELLPNPFKDRITAPHPWTPSV